jgi:nucleoid-associated protein YgaU
MDAASMTRENKLALVVGFALILMVGILISDHFSTARAQDPARINEGRPLDPLVTGRSAEPMLVELRQPEEREPKRASLLAPGPAAMNVPGLDERFVPVDEPRPINVRELDRIEIGGVRTVSPPTARAPEPGVAFHDVKPGESLSAIAHAHYGDRTLAAELARYNNISDPNTVRVNHRLRIPPIGQLRPGAAAPTPPAPATPAAPPPAPREPTVKLQEYTIKAGDSLSEISQRFLGTSRRWREIHELNRAAIRDPDNIPAGVTIRIPQR